MKVLLVDADPQCNASTYMLPENIFQEIYYGGKEKFYN